ncbi:TPA: hypothetical protein DCZ39_08920 [Patescibacteria group bacterium]|nr:hypothetical protein [Candidatus Gracilibacteria bacterium]
MLSKNHLSFYTFSVEFKFLLQLLFPNFLQNLDICINHCFQHNNYVMPLTYPIYLMSSYPVFLDFLIEFSIFIKQD